MAPTPKGKQATKGSKQIVEENVATVKFYRNMALGSTVAFLILMLIFFEFTGTSITMYIITLMILGGAYYFMTFMSRPKLADNGTILDCGSDLNMEGGIAEHVKDLIILTSATQILSLGSNYFWFLLLLAPIRAVWMLWGSIIQPWLAQKNEKAPEVDEKKQKKMERRMKRMQQR